MVNISLKYEGKILREINIVDIHEITDQLEIPNS